MNLGHGLTTAQGRISWNMLTNIMWFHFLQQPATSVQSKARLVQLLRQRLQLSAEEASQWYVSLGSRPGIDPRLAGCCQKGLLRNAGGLQAEYVCFLAICCNTVEQIGSARSLPLFLCRMCVLWGLASLLIADSIVRGDAFGEQPDLMWQLIWSVVLPCSAFIDILTGAEMIPANLVHNRW